MKQTKTSQKLTIILLIIFTLSLCGLSYADSAPVLPAFFYGDATVNADGIPIGSTLISKMNGDEVGEIDIDVKGKFGQESGENKLAVKGQEGEIEFYLNIPGYEEIKADQTFTFSPGSITYLKLDFNGVLVEIPQDSNEDSTDTGGSGGGSGGGLGDQDDEEVVSLYHFTEIFSDQQISFTLQNELLSLIKFQLVLNDNFTNVDFTFEVVETPDVEPLLDNVYQYIMIEATNLDDEDVNTAILSFKVPNSWFNDNNYDPESIIMLRYNNGTWEELTTVFEGADSTNNHYRSSTPGFSYFAIQANKLELLNNVTLNNDLTTSNNTNEVQETVEEDENFKTNNNLLTGFITTMGVKSNTLIAVLVIIVLVLSGIVIYDKFK